MIHGVSVRKVIFTILVTNNFMEDALSTTAPSAHVTNNYCIGSNIHLIDCSQKKVVYVKCIIFV